MKSLAAILFHLPATPEKPEKDHGAKPTDSFVQVLQASLGDSPRDSRSRLASTPSAETLSETRKAPISRAAQESPTAGAPDSQPAVTTRRGRDRSTAQTGLDARAPESTGQDSTRASYGRPKLHRTHQGYGTNPSSPASDALAAGPRPLHSGRAPQPWTSQPKPDTTPAGKRSAGAPSGEGSVSAGSLPKLLATPRAANRVATPTPPSMGKTATEPSGEKDMPPHTSTLVNALANPGVPSSRSGEQVRPEAWSIAGEGIDRMMMQGELAVPGGQMVPVEKTPPALPVPGEASECQPELPIRKDVLQATGPAIPAEAASLLSPDPVVLDAAPAQPEARPTQSQPSMPHGKAPALLPPSVGRTPRKHGGEVDHGGVSVIAIPVPVASARPPIPSGEPAIPEPQLSARVPAVIPADTDAPAIPLADQGDGAPAGQDTGEPPIVLTSPSPDPIELPESREPRLEPAAPQPHPEAPQPRRLRQGATVVPTAVEPKTNRTLPPHAPPSTPHTSFGPKLERPVEPSRLENSFDAHKEPTENRGAPAPQSKISIPANAIPLGEPMVALPSESAPLPVPPRPSPTLQGRRPAAAGSVPAAETKSSSPVAQGFVPTTHHKTVPQAAVATPSYAPPVHASSHPISPRSFSPARQAAGLPVNPLTSKVNRDTPALPPGSQPEPGSARRDLPVVQPSVEGAKPSLHGTPKIVAAEGAPSEGSPLPTPKIVAAEGALSEGSPLPTPDMVQAPVPPAIQPPQDASSPVTIEPVQDELLALPVATPPPRPRAKEPTAETAQLPMRDTPVQPARPSLPITVPSAQTDSRRTPSEPSNHNTLPSAETALPDTRPAALGHTSLQPTRTHSADTRPTPSIHDAAPSVPTGLTDPQPAPPQRESSAPVAEPAQVVTYPRDEAKPTPPVVPKLNPGERVPVTHQPKAEPAPSSSHLPKPSIAPADLEPTPVAQPTASLPLVEGPAPAAVAPTQVAQPTASLPLVEAPAPAAVAAATAPSAPSVPQAKAEHAPRPAGHSEPSSSHPRPTHSESSTKPIEPSAPSPAPQVESQPEAAPAESETEPSDFVKPVTVASTSRLGDAPGPVSAHSVQPPVPPTATIASPQADKPMPRPEALPAAAPAVPANLGPTAPILATTPTPPAPPHTEGVRASRRVWADKDEPRFSETASAPVPAPLPHARSHTAPAPIASTAQEPQKSFENQSPGNSASSQAVVGMTSTGDRAAESPSPQNQTSPSPSNPSVIGAASASPAATTTPTLEGRHPRLTHRSASAAPSGIDDGLSMTVMPHAAHMSIESDDGDLALHLRVRHGSADITVAGSMAPLFEARAPEARAALASEGLNLGRFDLGQQGGGGQQGQSSPERPERAPEPATPYRQQSNSHEPAPGDGRIHVTA